MNQNGIEDLISILYETIQDARAVPLSSEKCIIEREKVLDLLDEISNSLPGELKQAKTIVDSRSAVACMVQSTRDNGIMRGRVAASSTDAECYIYYLPSLNSVMPGDTVITSGTDSLFPKGLHIGTITAVSMDGGSEGSYAVVTPSVDFRHIEEVFVLREVIETDSDENLPAMGRSAQTGGATATPAPNATPTPSPTPAEETWSYPSAGATPEILETLPEDEWARGN